MWVCFISLEYFGWGKYGGIGKATRDIASGLAERGVDVSVVVPLGVGHGTRGGFRPYNRQRMEMRASLGTFVRVVSERGFVPPCGRDQLQQGGSSSPNADIFHRV